MLKTGTRFSLRDNLLFEISEVEITRVDSMIISLSSYAPVICSPGPLGVGETVGF